MEHIIIIPSLMLATVMGIAMPVSAQAVEKQTPASETACVATTPAAQIALNAAKNEARQMAEATNGWLTAYRAEASMHGAAVDSPCEMLGPDTWRFTFRGGEPTAVVVSEDYTLLSVVTVQGTGGNRTVTLDYNGPIDDYR
ncbi:MAG: hypothetical protein AAGF93_18585 [Cyanobacteria bacterium P01_H01_bin.105]